MEKRDLTYATDFVSKLSETKKEQLKAELRSDGYTDVDTEDGLIKSYDLYINQPVSGFSVIQGIFGFAIIIMVLISMFS